MKDTIITFSQPPPLLVLSGVLSFSPSTSFRKTAIAGGAPLPLAAAPRPAALIGRSADPGCYWPRAASGWQYDGEIHLFNSRQGLLCGCMGHLGALGGFPAGTRDSVVYHRREVVRWMGCLMEYRGIRLSGRFDGESGLSHQRSITVKGCWETYRKITYQTFRTP